MNAILIVVALVMPATEISAAEAWGCEGDEVWCAEHSTCELPEPDASYADDPGFCPVDSQCWVDEYGHSIE